MDEAIAYLIPILALIESGGDTNAVGDNGRAIGILQIHEKVVVDVNDWHSPIPPHEYPGCAKNPICAAQVCERYLTRWGSHIEGPIEARIEILARIWNGGPSGCALESTKPYGQKAVAYYRSIKDAEKILTVKHVLTASPFPRFRL